MATEVIRLRSRAELLAAVMLFFEVRGDEHRPIVYGFETETSQMFFLEEERKALR